MKRIVTLLAFLLTVSGVAQAKDWVIDDAQSKLSFVGEQSGQKFEGGFKKYTAQISFDPDHPETGKISVVVDITSAYAGSADRDAMLPQKGWFDYAHFPQAQFASTVIRQTGPGLYEVSAHLSIKGMTHDITLPFSLAKEGDHWRASGKVTLLRNDFALGQGEFAGEDYVKHAVDVNFDLIATPKP